MGVDLCICCGEMIPEGRFICKQCELKILNSEEVDESNAEENTEVRENKKC